MLRKTTVQPAMLPMKAPVTQDKILHLQQKNLNERKLLLPSDFLPLFLQCAHVRCVGPGFLLRRAFRCHVQNGVWHHSLGWGHGFVAWRPRTIRSWSKCRAVDVRSSGGSTGVAVSASITGLPVVRCVGRLRELRRCPVSSTGTERASGTAGVGPVAHVHAGQLLIQFRWPLQSE